ncbi:MAG: phosphoenolpyruvate kinase, partial [Gammaproteobacteria bacterium]|nr:phosphoenolpyruvate kinase [Gammaproteobacteria bacterium]
HSLRLGFYQSWDLNPAQLPVRYAAVYYFFLSGLSDATDRLLKFINQAAQASMVGNTFDDAASAQGLLNFFIAGVNCGALTEEEVLSTGITMEELHARSFLKIVENRTHSI